MSVLYRCLLDGESAARKLFQKIHQIVEQDLLDEASVLDAGDRIAIAGRNGGAVQVRIGRAYSDFDPGVTPWELSLEADLQDPISVFLAWQVLAAINMDTPVRVWVNQQAYPETAVTLVVDDVRAARFSDGTKGFVLTSGEFAELLDRSG